MKRAQFCHYCCCAFLPAVQFIALAFVSLHMVHTHTSRCPYLEREDGRDWCGLHEQSPNAETFLREKICCWYIRCQHLKIFEQHGVRLSASIIEAMIRIHGSNQACHICFLSAEPPYRNTRTALLRQRP